MKKTLLSVGILLSTLSMVMGQRYINLSGSTNAGFTAIYPLAGDVTSTSCGFIGGANLLEDQLASGFKAYSASYDANGLHIVSATTATTPGYYGVSIGLTETNTDCQNVVAASVNLNSGNNFVYFVAKNNNSTPIEVQATIGKNGNGGTNKDGIPNNFVLTNSYAVYSLDYTGNFLCQYACTPAGSSSVPTPVDQTAIDNFYFSIKGGSNQPDYSGFSAVGVDVSFQAVGVGYQTLSVSGSLSTFATTNSIQTVTLTGGILSSNLTVTAPTNFVVSSDGTTYGTTATFTPSAGLLNPTTLYVKYTGTGTSQGNITFAASSILTQNLLASGSVVTDYNAYSISQALVVSPNPSNQGYVDVTSSLNISNITVVNAQGAQVNASVNANRVNTSSLNPGVYTLLIDTEKGRTAKKIIVE